MDVLPGNQIKVVIDIDARREKIHARDSVVHERTAAGNIIIAQTEPPINRSMLGKEVIITYLVRGKNEPTRYGFPAKIIRFIDAYKLTGGHEARAVEVVRKKKPEPYSIRMFYRVTPSAKSGLRLFVDGRKVNIIDISLGGVKFSHDKDLFLEIRSVVQANLDIGGASFKIEAVILRSWEGESQGLNPRLRIASARFVDMDRKTESMLSRKIHQIEREGIMVIE